MIFRNDILSSSAKAIRMCSKSYINDLSFDTLHARYNRATPEKVLLYKHALSLYKLFNSTDHNVEWVSLNLNQINTSRQTHFITGKSNLKRVGLNAIANRYHILNGKIPLNNFNKSLNSFKMIVKRNSYQCRLKK